MRYTSSVSVALVRAALGVRPGRSARWRAQCAGSSKLARSGSCNLAFTEGACRDLELIETLTPAAISRYVLRWPRDDSIEVRRCPACGRSVARKRAGDR
jgi:hypothetical protein